MLSGHFGEESALSEEDESEEGVVKAKREDEMQADDCGRILARPREPKRQEGENEERSAVENGFAPNAENTEEMGKGLFEPKTLDLQQLPIWKF